MRVGGDTEKTDRNVNYLIWLLRIVATMVILTILSVVIYKDRTISGHDGISLVQARNIYIKD